MPGKGRGVQRKGPWRRYVEKRLQGREGARSSLSKKYRYRPLRRIPSSAGDGIRSESVRSGGTRRIAPRGQERVPWGMRVGNDSSHKMLADSFARNQGKKFRAAFSKKWQSHFFDTQRRTPEGARLCSTAGTVKIDAGCGDLRRYTHGHGPAVTDTNTIAARETAGSIGVYQNLLMRTAIADQKPAAFCTQHPCDHCN